jgi:hypothetical protein
VRVLVCGSRNWTDQNMVFAVLDGLYAEATVGYLVTDLGGFTLMQGCARGADEIAAWWADNSPMHSHNERPDDPPFEHLQFPADWNRHGRAAGLIRNQQMLDEGKPNLVVAFKDDFDWTLRRGGTEDMVRRAKAAGIPTYVVSRA